MEDSKFAQVPIAFFSFHHVRGTQLSGLVGTLTFHIRSLFLITLLLNIQWSMSFVILKVIKRLRCAHFFRRASLERPYVNLLEIMICMLMIFFLYHSQGCRLCCWRYFDENRPITRCNLRLWHLLFEVSELACTYFESL